MNDLADVSTQVLMFVRQSVGGGERRVRVKKKIVNVEENVKGVGVR